LQPFTHLLRILTNLLRIFYASFTHLCCSLLIPAKESRPHRSQWPSARQASSNFTKTSSSQHFSSFDSSDAAAFGPSAFGQRFRQSKPAAAKCPPAKPASADHSDRRHGGDIWSSRIAENERQLRKESEPSLARSRAAQAACSDCDASDASIVRRAKKASNESNQNRSSGVWTTQMSAELPSPTKSRDYRVLPKLLEPAMTFRMHRQLVESDDHAFNSDECDLAGCRAAKCRAPQSYSMENPPKLSAEKRRDHLHLLRRRKSRARFLKTEEQVGPTVEPVFSGQS
jgi:hypothetical protein